MPSDWDFGNGLVEISALTALIGATISEALVLGERGAPGMPWAAMSAFGVVFLIKACIAASTPAWLRDSLGVRTHQADLAVGLTLSFNKDKKGRIEGKSAGVIVSVRKVGYRRLALYDQGRI